MAKYTCNCGATYSLPEGSGGKRAKCKKCDVVFVIPDEPAVIPLADSDDDWDFDPPSASGASLPPTTPSASSAGGQPGQSAQEAQAYVEAGRSASPDTATERSMAGDLLWSLLFFADLRNAITFVMVWIMLTVAPLMPCFLVPLAFMAWYSAFRFEIIATAANGEDDLPSISITSYVDDILIPAVKWLGTWVIALLPATGYMIFAISTGRISQGPGMFDIVGGIAGMLEFAGGEMLPFVVLLLGGLFCWPLMVLCVGLGGLDTLLHVGRLGKTLVRTFPAYLCVVGVMVGTAFLDMGMQEAMNAGMGSAAKLGFAAMLGRAFLWYALAAGVGLYGEIVTLRMIGLYYHHCKDRFAWNWG